MTTSKNDITGDAIKTKGVTTDAYRESRERIFGKDRKVVENPNISDTPSTDDHGSQEENK